MLTERRSYLSWVCRPSDEEWLFEAAGWTKRNLKNSLKSGESGILANDLPGFFDGLKSLMRALATPIPLLDVILFIKPTDGKSPTIHLALHASGP
jgi:hypothetical protein